MEDDFMGLTPMDADEFDAEAILKSTLKLTKARDDLYAALGEMFIYADEVIENSVIPPSLALLGDVFELTSVAYGVLNNVLINMEKVKKVKKLKDEIPSLEDIDAESAERVMKVIQEVKELMKEVSTEKLPFENLYGKAFDEKFGEWKKSEESKGRVTFRQILEQHGLSKKF